MLFRQGPLDGVSKGRGCHPLVRRRSKAEAGADAKCVGSSVLRDGGQRGRDLRSEPGSLPAGRVGVIEEVRACRIGELLGARSAVRQIRLDRRVRRRRDPELRAGDGGKRLRRRGCGHPDESVVVERGRRCCRGDQPPARSGDLLEKRDRVRCPVGNPEVAAAERDLLGVRPCRGAALDAEVVLAEPEDDVTGQHGRPDRSSSDRQIAEKPVELRSSGDPAGRIDPPDEAVGRGRPGRTVGENEVAGRCREPLQDMAVSWVDANEMRPARQPERSVSVGNPDCVCAVWVPADLEPARQLVCPDIDPDDSLPRVLCHPDRTVAGGDARRKPGQLDDAHDLPARKVHAHHALLGAHRDPCRARRERDAPDARRESRLSCGAHLRHNASRSRVDQVERGWSERDGSRLRGRARRRARASCRDHTADRAAPCDGERREGD